MSAEGAFIPLALTDMALASLLVLLAAGLSLVLQLKMERPLLIAALRMVVQLAVMGYVLKLLFELVSPWLTALAALIMVLFAGREVMARQDRRLTGLWGYGLGTTSMFVAATLVTLLALTTQIRPDPWYDPRYALPILGMVLGNTMNGISLGLQTLTTVAAREKAAIEARLCLGATRHEAFRGITRSAMKAGLMPVINAMSAIGIVSLPGMMTGQILAGADPIEAAKYQMLIMFLIAGGTSMGTVAAVRLGAWRLTDERHRLRLERLSPAKT